MSLKHTHRSEPHKMSSGLIFRIKNSLYVYKPFLKGSLNLTLMKNCHNIKKSGHVMMYKVNDREQKHCNEYSVGIIIPRLKKLGRVDTHSSVQN